MNFALLAIDAQTRQLAHAIAASADHHLVGIWLDANAEAAGASDSHDSPSMEYGPPRDLTDDFDDDMATAGADCVIVAFHSDAAVLHARVRRLLMRGLAVVVSQPANLSVMAHYELQMLAEATDVPCVPLMTLQGHPAAEQLLEVTGCSATAPAASRLGQIEQIAIERNIASGSQAEVMRAYAADVDLIRQISGDIYEVSAMGASENDGFRLPVNVQMAGRQGVLARWSASTSETDVVAAVSVQGSEGQATLKMPKDMAWAVDIKTTQSETSRSWPPETAARARLQLLVQLLAHSPADTAARDLDWQGAGRCLELAEACEKSLRKGRTVHLQYDARDESSAFKGTMASLGCAVLLLGTGIMILSALLLKLAKVNGLDRLAAFLSKVPYALLAVLVVFLLLQLLRLVIPRMAGEE